MLLLLCHSEVIFRHKPKFLQRHCDEKNKHIWLDLACYIMDNLGITTAVSELLKNLSASI